MSDHKVTLEYDAVEDDGIWARCPCGWDENLGFDPTPLDTLKAENRHRQMVRYSPSSRAGKNERCG